MSVKKKSCKYCIVPECINTSINAPEKLFICLPSDQNLRRAWQHAMGRFKFVSNKGSRFCCEDHFNVEEDIENYLYLKTMKCGRIKLKPGVVPHIFLLPKEILRITHFREQKALIEELLREHSANEEILLKASKEEESPFIDRGVQVNLKPLRRSKAIQCPSGDLIKKSCKKRKRKRLNLNKAP
ncbi:hypothetical protein NQ317_018650 [Molorchus minor]|uniref:THAP-type domain-containing protein n=1 Tax=Molorchus minor TaxID=1323400 RepID=A0ABQ9IT65_9CUCU|nr:hypothetical protein NQ317_018650 [Molorchus minor]